MMTSEASQCASSPSWRRSQSALASFRQIYIESVLVSLTGWRRGVSQAPCYHPAVYEPLLPGLTMQYVHHFIPGNGSTKRVLLLLHGTGGSETDMVPLGRDLDPAAAVLSLRGNVSENGMPRFFRRLAEGVFDEEDVVRRAHELADFLKGAAEQYEFDPQGLTAVGYSNGANIASAVLMLRPGTITSAVLLRAMVPLTPPRPPELAGTRVLICSGRCDPIVPVENVERLAGMFRKAGAEVTHRFEESGHQLVFAEIEAARKWLRDSNPV